MSELCDGLAKQFIDYMIYPTPARLETLLLILPVLVKDERDRKNAENILRETLRIHQNRCFDRTAVCPRHIQ